MEIQLAPERLFVLEERLSAGDAERRAVEKRNQAFAAGLSSILQRPKPDEIVLIASERRLEPFWHVVARATYVYERRRDYTVAPSAPDVEAVTVEGVRREVVSAGGTRVFRLPALEHCRDEFVHEALVEGTTGEAVSDGAELLDNPRAEVSDPASLSADGTVVVPPEQRASFVVRRALSDVMKAVQADRILEESIALEATDLYYRPVRAYEFMWQGRNRTGVIEVDTITGQFRQGRPLIGQLRGMLTRDVLFDVGADTVGLLVPGGSIAVKLAKAAIDSKR